MIAAPSGGWPGQTGAYEHGGETFFGWINGGDADIEAASYDGALSDVGQIHAALEDDHHNSPSLLRRASDGKIVAAYAKHHNTPLYIAISTNADDATAWEAGTDIDSQLGGANYTYPNLFQLLDETDDPIYLFYRDHSGSTSTLAFSTSTDGGDTWAAQTALYSKSGASTYWRIDSNGTDRIDFVVTDGTGGTASAYHFYYTGSYFASDGTDIGSPPFDETDLTKIYDGASAGVRYPAALSAYGGAIVAGLVTQPGGDPPNDYRYLRWNGSAWTDNLIVGSGNDPGGPMFEGGFAIAYDDPDIVYCSVYTAGEWEMFKYVTADAGASWTATTLTEGSAEPNFYPVPVREASTSLRCLWLSGATFTSESNFSLGIKGTVI